VPFASDVVVIVRDAGATARLSAFDAEWLPLSATVAVKLAVPAAVGVPLIVPLALRLSPAGSAPLLTVHAYPPVPPVAASAWEYTAPTLPFASDVVVIVRDAAATDRLSGFDAE
jgi:hypothetical protein